MTNLPSWKTEDFENISWHDVHVHGFRLEKFNPDEGCSDLVLDIDYIMEWHNADGAFEFTICPADLRFQEVFGLQLALDYAQPTAGMCPFSIQSIERQTLEFQTGHKSYNWHILLNWPRGEIKFQAPRFTLIVTGTPKRNSGQWLGTEERL